MFAIRWLTYLAGTGVTPAGMIDLARPHSPELFSASQYHKNINTFHQLTQQQGW